MGPWGPNVRGAYLRVSSLRAHLGQRGVVLTSEYFYQFFLYIPLPLISSIFPTVRMKEIGVIKTTAIDNFEI